MGFPNKKGRCTIGQRIQDEMNHHEDTHEELLAKGFFVRPDITWPVLDKVMDAWKRLEDHDEHCKQCAGLEKFSRD